MNPLDSYLTRTGRRARELARAAGLTDQHVSKLRRGHARPSLDAAVSIARATDGAVPVEAWASQHDGEAA